MWQKCPICNGTGNSNSLVGEIVSSICRVCKGKGIINEITGLPPASQNSGDFRDNCEQFGDK